MALGTPERLKAQVVSDETPEPTLEDVFLAVTGRPLSTDDDQEVTV
ncbi:MAG: hypothetical protein Q9O62_06700 [Ardenticatenia bacterium]|nr:hypothetical protein [Ardenticatenia bacterium]